MSDVTDLRVEAAARAVKDAMLRQGKSPDAHDLAQAAIKAADAEAWQPIESAPKDGTAVLAKVHDDLFPRIKPNREDLRRWNGCWLVVAHSGVHEDGFDLGWYVAAPVGNGGLTDDWFVGWQPLPPASVMVGHDE